VSLCVGRGGGFGGVFGVFSGGGSRGGFGGGGGGVWCRGGGFFFWFFRLSWGGGAASRVMALWVGLFSLFWAGLGGRPGVWVGGGFLWLGGGWGLLLFFFHSSSFLAYRKVQSAE